MIFTFLVNSLWACIYSVSLDKKTLTISPDVTGIVTNTCVSNEADANILECVNILEGITEIGESAFKQYSNIQRVNMPPGVKHLRNHCFNGCSKLASITLQYGLVSIESHVFYDCISLINVTLPSTVSEISTLYTFCNCRALQKFIVSEQNKFFSSVDDGKILIFNNTIAIRSVAAFSTVRIPDQVTQIAFGFLDLYPSVTEVIFSSSGNLEYIEDQAFRYTSITEVRYPSGVKYIGSEVLFGCFKPIEYIWIPNTLESYGDIFNPVPNKIEIESGCPCLKQDSNGNIFNAKMTELLIISRDSDTFELPKTIESIKVLTITSSKNLSHFSVQTDHSKYSSYDNVLYNLDQTTLLACPGGVQGVQISPLCITIGSLSFNSIELQYVKFSPGRNLINILGRAFEKVILRTPLNLPEGLTSLGYCSIYVDAEVISIPSTLNQVGMSFYRCGATILDFSSCSNLYSLGDSCFLSSYNLKTVILPPNLQIIPPQLFQNVKSLEYITIPASVTAIQDSAFIDCSKLSIVTFEGSLVTQIKNSAFSGCNLTEIIIPSSVTLLESNSFNNNKYLNNVIFEEESMLTSIQMGVFRGCSSITSLRFGKHFEVFPPGALYDMQSLTEIIVDEQNPYFVSYNGSLYSADYKELIAFPGGRNEYIIHPRIHSFGESAFFRCEKLEKITVNGEVVIERIKSQSFLGCIKLKSFEIPKSISQIDPMAFSECTSLESIRFENNSQIITLSSNTFHQCSNLRAIYFTEFSKLQEIEADVFAGLSQLSIFETPKSLRMIGKGSFANCISLKEFNFGYVTRISENAFEGCASIKFVSFSDNLEYLGVESFGNCQSLKHIQYCGSNEIKNSAFDQDIIADVTIAYQWNTFGGLAVNKILDQDCQLPSVAFTFALSKKNSLLIGQIAGMVCEE